MDIGILTALYNRERTGLGDYVMTSLYGVGGWVSSNCSIGTQYHDPWPRTKWTQSPMSQAYLCSDGRYVQLFVNEYEKFWDVFVDAFGIQDLRGDSPGQYAHSDKRPGPTAGCWRSAATLPRRLRPRTNCSPAEGRRHT